MKVLFIHGLASSGAYKMASSLRILLKGSEVIAPDVPIEPREALALLEGICRDELPDLVVGLSLGGFWAQKLRGFRKILVNPDFHISRLLRTKVGECEYLSPRRDGALTFTVTEELCDEYAGLENVQFDGLDAAETALTTGMFADRDEMVDCSAEFEEHYPGRSHSYPGTHLPNYPEIKKYIIPVIENEVPRQ
jgi:uncharacterized protein